MTANPKAAAEVTMAGGTEEVKPKSTSGGAHDNPGRSRNPHVEQGAQLHRGEPPRKARRRMKLPDVEVSTLIEMGEHALVVIRFVDGNYAVVEPVCTPKQVVYRVRASLRDRRITAGDLVHAGSLTLNCYIYEATILKEFDRLFGPGIRRGKRCVLYAEGRAVPASSIQGMAWEAMQKAKRGSERRAEFTGLCEMILGLTVVKKLAEEAAVVGRRP